VQPAPAPQPSPAPSASTKEPDSAPIDDQTDGTPILPSAPRAASKPNATDSVDVSEDGIPQALLDLMHTNSVKAEEIQFAVHVKGYFPNDTPIKNYPADFINGVLIAAWPQVLGMVEQTRKDNPFYQK